MRVKTRPWYEDVTQMIALDDDISDLEPVSLRVPIFPACIWNQLTYPTYWLQSPTKDALQMLATSAKVSTQ
jgi:hypothetical protein